MLGGVEGEPPANTDEPAQQAPVPDRRAGRGSRPSTVSSVCWRGMDVRPPPVRRRNRSSSAAAMRAGGIMRTRAAASSMASGRPSRRRQICATASPSAPSAENPGRTWAARSANSRTPASSSSDGTRPRSAHPVPREARGWWPAPTVPAPRRAVPGPAPHTVRPHAHSCRGSRGPLTRQAARGACRSRGGPPPRPARRYGPRRRRPGSPSETGASSTHRTPSRNRSAASAAAWSASRVFPQPPAPVRVTRRAASRAGRSFGQFPVAAHEGSELRGQVVGERH